MKLLKTLKRLSWDIAWAFFLIWLVILLPDRIFSEQATMGLMSLLITKMVDINLGVITAHISRMLIFPYLNLERMIKEHHWGGIAFLTAWYVIIIFCFARGG